jgi:hypothetical protein
MRFARTAFAFLLLLAAVSSSADDLAFNEHRTTIVNGQIMGVLTSNVATLPFNLSATGENYTGTIEVNFPATVSGKPDSTASSSSSTHR